jgi:predicted Zn-dependent protease
LRRALEHDGGDSISSLDPRVELGAFLFRQGRLEEAQKVLETAVKARPDSARGFFELARVLVQVDRLDDAAARLKEAERLDPNSAATRLLLGKVYFRLGRIEEGRRETEIGRKLSTAADQARVRAQQAVLADPRPATEQKP